MQKSKLFSLFLLLSFVMVGCGKNPHLIEEIAGEIGGTDPINTQPTPTPTPQPTPTVPPGAKQITLGARDYTAKDAEQGVTLPYQTKKIKTIQYGVSQTGLLCRLFGGDQCVHNRQVLFAFDLPRLGKISKIHDVRIFGNFVTYGKSYDTEILCLNNLQTCSGNGIKKIPIIGLSKYVKKKFWNQDYWAAGYESVVLNNVFQGELNQARQLNDNVHTTGIRNFSLGSLFELNESQLKNLVQQEETLWFTLADDTFVQDPTLMVIYE